MKKLKLLLIADSPTMPTGIAETTRLIFGALLDHHECHYELCQIGLFHSHSIVSSRWPVIPTQIISRTAGMVTYDTRDLFGQKTFETVLSQFQPDIVFAFNDPERLQFLCTHRANRNYALVLHINLDGLPVPPGFVSKLSLADYIVTSSEFARSSLLAAAREVNPQRVEVLYSPADTNRFFPAAATDRAMVRRDIFPKWMPEDAFVLGWVGRNQWRKQTWMLYKVIRIVRYGGYLVCAHCCRVTLDGCDTLKLSQRFAFDRKPLIVQCPHCASKALEMAAPMPRVFLWLHMAKDDPRAAWPIPALEHQFEVKPNCDIHYTFGDENGVPLGLKDVAKLYRAWDALLYLSGGEGFGLPPWEAMCSGTPVVFTDYSSHAEFLNYAKAGIGVSGLIVPEPTTCIGRMIGDVAEIIEALRALYCEPHTRQRLGSNGCKFVEAFTPDKQVKPWHRIFQSVVHGG